MINLIIPNKLSLSEAEQALSQLQSLVQNEKDSISKALEKKYQKETNAEYLRTLALRLETLYSKLSRDNYPKDGVCSHHGFGVMVKNDYLELTVLEGKLLLKLYRSKNSFLPNGTQVGYSKSQHLKKIKAIQKALKCQVLDKWNDSEKSNGFSLILNCSIPKGLEVAIKNYHQIDNVFSFTKQEEIGYLKFMEWMNG